MAGIKPNRQTRKVLTALLTGASNLGGGTIWHLTGGVSGRVYTVLTHLEAAGWVTSEWEDGWPGRRRRFYRLTPFGREKALDLLNLTQ
jgi:PadR family transcriptional regulator, regulatory protein PadR